MGRNRSRFKFASMNERTTSDKRANNPWFYATSAAEGTNILLRFLNYFLNERLLREFSPFAHIRFVVK